MSRHKWQVRGTEVDIFTILRTHSFRTKIKYMYMKVCTVPLILYPGTTWGLATIFTPHQLSPLPSPREPINYVAVLTSENVRGFAEQKSVAKRSIRTSDRPVRSLVTIPTALTRLISSSIIIQL
jgi:hypothetical protein